jgi:hypothetical protein
VFTATKMCDYIFESSYRFCQLFNTLLS